MEEIKKAWGLSCVGGAFESVEQLGSREYFICVVPFNIISVVVDFV